MAAEPELTPMSIINYLLHRMNYTGYNPRIRTKLKIVLGFIMVLFMFLTFCLEGIFLFTHNYNDLGYLMFDTILFAAYWQVTVKLYTLFAKHAPLLKLIDTVDYKFWNLTILPEEERPAIQNIYKIAKLASRAYEAGILLTLMGHYITSYLKGKENLINNIWMPEALREWNRTVLGHHVICFIQAVIMGLADGCGLTTIDGMYLVLISFAIAQFKIIKCRFLGLNPNDSAEENKKKIAECINHHNLLFNFLAGVEEIFATAILHTAGTVIILIVLSMFCCMVENDIGSKITYTFIITCIMSQLFIYCAMGQLIQNETESVANVVYMSRWQDIPDKNIRLSLVLIIERSQKCVILTMGGFFILCLETFTKVSKMMFSLLTLMMNFDIGKS